MNKISHGNLVTLGRTALFAILATVAYQTQAASINFYTVQGANLVGRAPGNDGYWGTADDATGIPNFNTTGASNYSYNSDPVNGYIDFVTGSTASEPTSALSGRFTNLSVTSTYSGVTYTLDTSAPDSTYTYTDAFHYTTDIYETDNVNQGQYHVIGQHGYEIYNTPSMSDPSVVFAGASNEAALTATFNLLKADLPSNWTALLIEFSGFADSNNQVTNWPAVGVFSANYTTDLAVLPSAVPLPSAIVLVASALMALGLVGRRRTKG